MYDSWFFEVVMRLIEVCVNVNSILAQFLQNLFCRSIPGVIGFQFQGGCRNPPRCVGLQGIFTGLKIYHDELC